jgi:hypothetical protein
MCLDNFELDCGKPECKPPDPVEDDSGGKQTGDAGDSRSEEETGEQAVLEEKKQPVQGGPPGPCRSLECPPSSHLDIKQHDERTVMSECVDANGKPNTARRYCYKDGRWDETALKNGAIFGMRSFYDAEGKLQHKAFRYNGQSALSCRPQSDDSLSCQVSVPDILPAECWKTARLPKNKIQAISSAKQFRRFFGCDAKRADLDWSQTRFVAVRQHVSAKEKIVLEAEQKEGHTELIVKVKTICGGIGRRYDDQRKAGDYRALLALPRDETKLSTRIELPTGRCPPIP